ncbi:HdeD family acid-resistance protein [Howardella ureilytica]|nr:DUF308 domain-containing protein [Lachnospiraceae bacterium]
MSNRVFGDEFRNHWNERLKSMRIIGFIVSIALIAIGITCIFVPMLSVNLMHYIFASVLLASGIFYIVNYFTVKSAFRSGGYLAMAIIQVIISLILFFSPSVVTIEILAFMLAFEMLVSGIDALSIGVKVGSGMAVFVGIMNIAMAVILFISPFAFLYAFVIIMPVYMIVRGVSLLSECIVAKTR